MICPVEIARDLSAFRAVRVRDHAKHGFLLEDHNGAGDESRGSDLTGDGKTDYLVAGSGDHRTSAPTWFVVILGGSRRSRAWPAQDF